MVDLNLVYSSSTKIQTSTCVIRNLTTSQAGRPVDGRKVMKQAAGRDVKPDGSQDECCWVDGAVGMDSKDVRKPSQDLPLNRAQNYVIVGSVNVKYLNMARAVYRDLLRSLNTHVTRGSGNRQFEKFVAKEFRKYKNLSDPALIEQKLSLAKDYTMLVNSVHYHKDLLISYNIGVDRAAEQAARLKDTANRVGLQMPTLYEDLDRRL